MIVSNENENESSMKSNLLSYIDHRMRAVGYKDYNLKPERILLNSTKTTINIDAVNEYYYLVTKSLPSGTIITSDSECFLSDSNTQGLELIIFKEFTGNIRIEIPEDSAVIIEFLRVIPL